MALLRQLRGVFWHFDNLDALLLSSYPNLLAVVTVSPESATIGSPAYCRIPYGNSRQGLSKTFFFALQVSDMIIMWLSEITIIMSLANV